VDRVCLILIHYLTTFIALIEDIGDIPIHHVGIKENMGKLFS
jgi:hypothetical protein